MTNTMTSEAMTDAGISNIWKQQTFPAYTKLERNRSYALTDEARRHLVFLWRACKELEPENPAELFKWSLEQLADDAGVNVLQPLPPAELKPPEMWKDLWNRDLPNPFATGDLKGQTLLMQRDEVLGEWLKNFAESPYGAAVEWQDKEAAILKQKGMKYDSDTHAANVFANGADETTRGRFVRNADSATVERCKWESLPVTFPSPTTKNFNLTIQGRITKNPRLNAIYSGMLRHEQQFIEGARAKARADIEAAQKHLKELETVSK
jgi:hypothetical protein